MTRRGGSKKRGLVPPELMKVLNGFDALDEELRESIIDGVESGRLSPQEVLEFMKSVPGRGALSQQGTGREKSNHVAEIPAEEVHRQLASAVDCVGENVSDTHWNEARTLDAVVKLKEIDPQGEVSGAIKIARQKLQHCRLILDPDEMSVSYACSCEKSSCLHLACFVLELISQLEDFRSSVGVKIFGEEEAKNRHQRILDQAEGKRRRSQEKLFRTLSKLGTSTTTPLSLDEQAEVAVERVSWNLLAVGDDEFGRIDFKAIIQKVKKNGAWSKGREVTLKTFMEMSRDSWTSIDRQIASQINYERWSYHTDYSFDGICLALEGTDVFELNRKPATMQIRPMEVVVVDSKEGGWELKSSSIALRDEWGGDAIGLSMDEGVIVISESRASAVWIPISEHLDDLVDVINAEDIIFREDERDELLRKLNFLETTVPVKLPESLVSEERQVDVDPVLMLRMKKTGSLEATLCVRDNRQMLMLPGDGQLRRLEMVDNAPVQFIRDDAAERRVVKELGISLTMGQFMSIRESTWLIDDPEAVIDLLQRAAGLVDEGALVLVWHKESVKQVNVIGSLSSANVSVKVTKQRDWFNVNGSCRVGDREVLLRDVLAGLRGATTMNGLVEVSPGQWASIADDFRATLQQLADVANESRGKLQLDQAAAMSLATIEENALNIQADKAWKKCLENVRSIESINPDPPTGLDCDLRDYQLEGFRWMCRLAEWGVGGILADDMGLGKTVQTLAVLLQRIKSGPALVIAPTSLGFNWESECRKFAPSLTPKLLRESDREKLVTNASEGDVIICSYGLALRESELLQKTDWGTLVLDEAQNIKNSNTKTAKEVRKLSAGWKVALTGTPMENHLGELWSLFRAVSPGVLGSWEQFRKKFASPIEKENNDERRLALSRVISPFILRRSKKEVLTDLPERSESNLLIELTQQEQERYDQVRLAAVGDLDQLGSENLSTDQRFKVLQLLTRLRQIACHVGLIDEDWKDGSSKLRMLMERLEQLKERGHRALIFSQFTSHLGLIKQACEQAGFTYQYLDGQTTPKARQQRVEAFQAGEGDIFLISLKAGGTGLNLTAADYVIHMDPWWNPAVEDQATDRAHRIGQVNNVMVYRIIAKGTIEEQIISLHAEKRDLVEGVLSGSEASGKMSTDQLATLIRAGVTTKS